MHMVIPHVDDELYLYGLMAFLSSSFASCWVDEHAMERNISTADLMGIPVPSGREQWALLADLGGRATLARNDVEALLELARLIDDAVLGFLDVPSDVAEALERRLCGYVAPEGIPRYHVPLTEDHVDVEGRIRSRFGVVHAINDGRLLIEVVGVNSPEGQWLEPPPGFPAGLCRPGATFDVLLADGAPLERGRFFYQPESWVDTDSLWNEPAYHDAGSAVTP